MGKYRKKPVVIEAVQLLNTDESIKECIDFIWWNKIKGEQMQRCIKTVKRKNGMNIQTLEGDMKANFGDYIIRGVNGEHYPCKPDIFEKTYDKIYESKTN